MFSDQPVCAELDVQDKEDEQAKRDGIFLCVWGRKGNESVTPPVWIARSMSTLQLFTFAKKYSKGYSLEL